MSEKQQFLKNSSIGSMSTEICESNKTLRTDCQERLVCNKFIQGEGGMGGRGGFNLKRLSTTTFSNKM